MIDINLLPPQNVLSQREQQIRQKIIWLTAAVTVILGVTVGSSFLADSYLQSRLTGISQEHARLEGEFAALVPIATDLRTVRDKVAAVGSLRATQRDFAAQLADINKFIGEGAAVQGLNLEANGRVRFSVKTTNLAELGAFLDKFAEKSSILNKVTLSGLRQEAGGGFGFSIEGQYGKDEKTQLAN